MKLITRADVDRSITKLEAQRDRAIRAGNDDLVKMVGYLLGVAYQRREKMPR